MVDRAGNAVSTTTTLNFSYGFGLVAEGTGVLLNNEMDDFSAKTGSVNATASWVARPMPWRPGPGRFPR